MPTPTSPPPRASRLKRELRRAINGAEQHQGGAETAPPPDRWYNLTLGSSFNPDSSNKYCMLRYEFKPASIDKAKAGTMHKNKESRVSVEFQNNQLGKPKVAFEGSSEDYKDNDAVLFFDGETFRLERLHRAVKQLRNCRKPVESAATAVSAAERLSPVAKSGKSSSKMSTISFPAVPVEVERIDISEPEIPGPKNVDKGILERPDPPNIPTASPVPKNDEYEEEDQEIDIDDIFGNGTPDNGDAAEGKSSPDIGMNPRHGNESDDEIAVDVSGDEADKGPNAAEALRAQVNNAGGRDEQSSSSSSSSSSSGWEWKQQQRWRRQ